MERVLSLVDGAVPQPPADIAPYPSAYRGLLDEYSVADDAGAHLHGTPDIVALDRARAAAPPPDPAMTPVVRRLATSDGTKHWIRQALLQRERSFTHGKALKLFATTWNVNGKRPQLPLDTWLLSDANRAAPPDLFLVGFQEVQSLSGISGMSSDETRGAAWREAVERCVATLGDYVTVGAKQMVGIFLIVLVKEVHRPFVQNVAMSLAGTGLMRTGGNKGAVSCRFVLYDKAFCCVSSHLAAHDYNLERRNQDFHDVLRKSVFSIRNPEASPFDYRALAHGDESNAPTDEQPALHRGESRYSSMSEPTATVGLLEHDVVLWVGDLNYRIDELPPKKVVDLIDDGNWAELAKYDQLMNTMKAGEAFQGFEELPLAFAPTYKYDLFNNSYAKDEEENTLKRTPAWTDRILWRDRVRSLERTSTDGLNGSSGAHGDLGDAKESKASPKSVLDQHVNATGLRVSDYRRHELFSSDHRPVSAVFDIDVSVIDVAKRNEAVEAIHDALRKLHNLLRPRLSLSTTTVDIGPVEFGTESKGSTPLIVRNLGHLPVTVAIASDEMPRWLCVDGTPGVVESNQEAVMYIRAGVGVDDGEGMGKGEAGGQHDASKLNSGEEKLVTCVPLLIQGKPEAFVTITGQYKPTSFGNTITQLALHPRPYAAAAGAPAYPLRPLTVPKEIHLLVSYLVDGWDTRGKTPTDTCALHADETLFVADVDGDAVRAVRRTIDEGRPVAVGTPPAAVAACLLELLRSQAQPVVPHECYAAVAQLARGDDFNFDDLRVALERAGARAPVFNTLVYLGALLAELAVTKLALERVKYTAGAVRFRAGATDADTVLRLFAEVILRPREQDAADAEAEMRIRFVRKLVLLCSNDMKQAVFDYSTKTKQTA